MLPEGKFELIKRYCSIGLAVIPLAGKRPIWDNWTNQWTTDENRALQIWKQYPDANVGMYLPC
jgi:bifunctional DNA primase/polymerase-like protein